MASDLTSVRRVRRCLRPLLHSFGSGSYEAIPALELCLALLARSSLSNSPRHPQAHSYTPSPPCPRPSHSLPSFSLWSLRLVPMLQLLATCALTPKLRRRARCIRCSRAPAVSTTLQATTALSQRQGTYPSATRCYQFWKTRATRCPSAVPYSMSSARSGAWMPAFHSTISMKPTYGRLAILTQHRLLPLHHYDQLARPSHGLQLFYGASKVSRSTS